MSRKLVRAPLALTTEGRLLVNLVEFDGSCDPQALLWRALGQRGRLFIGIELTGPEAGELMEGGRIAVEDRIAHLVARRQR